VVARLRGVEIQPGQSTDSLRYVTLDLASDSHARAAIEAYADSCAVKTPWLADILRARLETLNRSWTAPKIILRDLREDEAASMPLTYCEQTARAIDGICLHVRAARVRITRMRRGIMS